MPALNFSAALLALFLIPLASAGNAAPEPVPPALTPTTTPTTPAGDAPKKPAEDAKTPPPPPLYVRFGGAAKIADIVDDFLTRLDKDPAFIANANVAKALTEISKPALRFYVTTLLCQLCHGPEVYGGPPIHEIYVRLKLSDAEWKALIADFEKALDSVKIAPDDKKEFLSEVTSVRAQLADVVARIFEEKGVFVVIPAGWERLKSEDPNTILHVIAPASKETPDALRPGFRIVSEPLAAGLEMTAKEFMKANQLQMSKSLQNFHSVSTRSLNFNNDPVEELACQFSVGKAEASSEMFFLVKNKRGYTIQFLGPKDTFEKYNATFNDVLRTLRIE
ncbi:MAG TPA: hypothetical protein VKX17_09205 [Planctomycetota bacterium]|nr:hypothetical protein [Planctomycetota bacterium]